MKDEHRKKYLAKLSKNNMGKALREEFEIEIANIKEENLDAEEISDIKASKIAIQRLRNVMSKIEAAGRTGEVSETQNEYA